MTRFMFSFSQPLSLLGCAGLSLLLGWGQVGCASSDGDEAGPLGGEQISGDVLQDTDEPDLAPDALDRGPGDGPTAGDGTRGRNQPDEDDGPPRHPVLERRSAQNGCVRLCFSVKM